MVTVTIELISAFFRLARIMCHEIWKFAMTGFHLQNRFFEKIDKFFKRNKIGSMKAPTLSFIIETPSIESNSTMHVKIEIIDKLLKRYL